MMQHLLGKTLRSELHLLYNVPLQNQKGTQIDLFFLRCRCEIILIEIER